MLFACARLFAIVVVDGETFNHRTQNPLDIFEAKAPAGYPHWWGQLPMNWSTCSCLYDNLCSPTFRFCRPGGLPNNTRHWIKTMEDKWCKTEAACFGVPSLIKVQPYSLHRMKSTMKQPGHKLAKVVVLLAIGNSADYPFCAKCLWLYWACTPALSDHNLSMDKMLRMWINPQSLSHLTSLKKLLAPEAI